MTKEQLQIGNDLQEQILKIRRISERIGQKYRASGEDKALQELLNECDIICSALVSLKQQKFEEL